MRSELDTIDHVLRGSLNTILLNLQLLATSVEADEQARSLLNRASGELRRFATELLPAALRIVSLEIGELRPVDLGQLVEGARAEHGLGEAAETRRGPSVVGDPGLLATAVRHLVGNAVAATPAGASPPQVSVDAGPGDTASLVVRNTCASQAPPLTADGIPAARGHLGGLVAAMRIARLHAGTLTYERRDSELTARLSIPAGSGVDPGTGCGAPGSPPPRAGDSPRRGT